MKLTALIADDETGFADAFQAYFSYWDVEKVYDGVAAREILERREFDVVVLDHNMPGQKGQEVLRWMSSQPQHRHTCTIMCTAYGEITFAVEAIKLGAWNYIPKPVEDLSLLEALLIPGVAIKRCDRARSLLMAASNLESFFKTLDGVCTYASDPGAGPNFLLVGPDGEIIQALGGSRVSRVKKRHKFVQEVINSRATIFSDTAETTTMLEPVLPDSKTIAAVPVRDAKEHVFGVLDMEASYEKAFGPAWQEVLRYIADLLAMKRFADEVKDIQEQQKASEMVYREFRHRVATHAQVVSMQTRELLDSKLGDEQLRRVTIIQRNADTIDSIVGELREAANTAPLDLIDSVELQGILQTAADDSQAKEQNQPGQPSTRYFGLETFPRDLKIRADKPELTYSFQCILDNAWEAIADRSRQDPDWSDKEKGRIEVSVDRNKLGVSVSISDNGIGFEAGDNELLFSPLYSTKVRAIDGEEHEATGVDRITRTLAQVGAALSANKAADDALANKDLVRSRIEIQDGLQEARVTVRDQSGKDPLIEFSCRLTGPHVDRNRGMGLFSVRRIILQHGGTIEAHSEGVFKGATFEIWLPISG